MRLHSDDPPSSGSDHQVTRPSPTRTLTVRGREWLEWFGVARLVTSAVAVVIVSAGAFFLIRTPVPPPESALPVAEAAGTLPVTLPPPPPTETASVVPVGRVVVHVAGAVIVPGIYELDIGSRVADAVDAAGGLSEDADADRINLAAPLVDGSRVHLPRVGEESPVPAAVPTEGSSVDDTSVGPVDVNVADAGDLETLPGVGPATAAAIVAERERNGPFVSIADLERVPGIGPVKLAALDGLVVT